MCLITNDPTVKVANRDMTFWKVIRMQEDGGYRTPYMDVYVRPNTLYVESVEPTDFKMWSCKDEDGVSYYHVENYAYHMFKTFLGALRLKKSFIYQRGLRVVRAVVPKGTLYVEGEYDGIKSIAAKKVMYKFKE